MYLIPNLSSADQKQPFPRLVSTCPSYHLTGHCYTGKKELPDIKMLAEKLLVRRQFIPDPQGSSLMFAFFAQHFTHQFFKSDMKKGPAFTKAQGHGVRGSPSSLSDTWRGNRGAMRSTWSLIENTT